jgi:hypothetical protein
MTGALETTAVVADFTASIFGSEAGFESFFAVAVLASLDLPSLACFADCCFSLLALSAACLDSVCFLASSAFESA